MLKANHWIEHRVHNGRVRERTDGVEGVYNPIGRTTISTNQTPQGSQGLWEERSKGRNGIVGFQRGNWEGDNI